MKTSTKLTVPRPSAADIPELMTVAQAHVFLGYDERYIRKFIDDGLPIFQHRLVKEIRIPKTQALEWVAAHTGPKVVAA